MMKRLVVRPTKAAFLGTSQLDALSVLHLDKPFRQMSQPVGVEVNESG
jgi:hypothetical protein